MSRRAVQLIHGIIQFECLCGLHASPLSEVLHCEDRYIETSSQVNSPFSRYVDEYLPCTLLRLYIVALVQSFLEFQREVRKEIALPMESVSYSHTREYVPYLQLLNHSNYIRDLFTFRKRNQSVLCKILQTILDENQIGQIGS